MDLSYELEFFLPRPKECKSIDYGLGGRWANFYWCINAAEKECKSKKLKVVRTTGLFLNTVLFLAKDPCFSDKIRVLKFLRDPRANLYKLKSIAQLRNETLEKVASIWCDRHLRGYTIMKNLEIRYPDAFLRVPYEDMIRPSSMYCFQTIDDYLHSDFGFHFRDPNLLRLDCQNSTQNDRKAIDIASTIDYLTNWVYSQEDKDDLNLLTKACVGLMYEVGYQLFPKFTNSKTMKKKVLNNMRRKEDTRWCIKALRNKYEEPNKIKFKLVHREFFSE